MDTDLHLSLKKVKWLPLRYNWVKLPCAYCLYVLGLSSCTTLPNATLSIKGGVIYACVDASFSKEDKCYKVVEDIPSPQKDTETPE